MTINLTIPDDLALELARTAQASGRTPEEVAVVAIRRNLQTVSKLNEALLPVRTAFQQSGLTEDEAVELFESEKHELRKMKSGS